MMGNIPYLTEPFKIKPCGHSHSFHIKQYFKVFTFTLRSRNESFRVSKYFFLVNAIKHSTEGKAFHICQKYYTIKLGMHDCIHLIFFLLPYI